MRKPREYPALVVVSNRKWDSVNYLIQSEEDLNLFALSFIKQGLETNGDYCYYKDVANEYLDDKSPNIQLSAAEVENLPEHLKESVQKERSRYKNEAKLYKSWLKLIEYMEDAVEKNDPSKCWAIILKAKEFGWHEEGDQIDIEYLVKYKSED